MSGGKTDKVEKTSAPTPVMAFVARSGTGKTTLVESLIALAKARGLKVGALKHDAHRFEIDRPGKDSYRFTAAGADAMALVSDDTTALVRRHAQVPDVEALLRTYFSDMDLVLVEGWKTSALPRIEVHRPGLGRPLLSRGETHDPHLVAVACDGPLEVDVPVLPLDDPAAVLDFINARFGLY